MLFSSGIGRYLREILRRMPDVPLALDVFCHPGPQREWLATHVPAARCRITSAPLYSLREQLQARRLPPDVTYWVPHYNVPWWLNCRLITTVHDLAPLALPDLFGGMLRRWAARSFFAAVHRRSQHILTVSQFTRAELLSRHLARPHRVSVIPNGVSSFWFQGGPAIEPATRLIYVGNLKPHKNLGRLVDALEIVRRSEPVELDVVGRIDGFRTGLGQPLLSRLRQTPWVRLLGEVSDEALRRHYGAAQAMVFPSLYEGFGLPLLEAMAAGCPVLSSNAGALLEVAGPPRAAGGAADFFDPYDTGDMAASILRLCRLSGEERREVQQKGRRIAGRYSWDDTATATWAILCPPSAT